jgi:hypothetical protein
MMLRSACLLSAPRVGVLVVCLAIGPLAACKKAEEPAKPAPAPAAAAKRKAGFRVTGVLIGSGIGADKKVNAPKIVFKPSETIYASVLSDGAAPAASVRVRWTSEDGHVVQESTQNIAPTGPAVTEFHASKPEGWPAGKYKLEVSANGQPAGTLQFSVAD